MVHTIRVWYVPYAYGTILYTIRVRYDHTRIVSSYHMRLTIIYVKIASRFEIELALTAMASFFIFGPSSILLACLYLYNMIVHLESILVHCTSVKTAGLKFTSIISASSPFGEAPQREIHAITINKTI